MNRSQYYESLKLLARELRARFSLSTPRVMRSDLRRIYREEKIAVDLWPKTLRNLRGAYFRGTATCGPSVMLAKGLPEEPMVFTMAHELKHHFADQDLELSFCDISNEKNYIEIGAEVFAAEMIFPEADFAREANDRGLRPGAVQPPDVVRLKRETRTTLSYTGLVKRLDFLGLADGLSFKGVRWKKLEEELYGEPLYKRLLRGRRR